MKRKEMELPSVEEALRRYWGHTEFRPMQREIIDSILSGRDTLALLPTGGGKSLTYQIPALAREGLCLVVTPLIALMKDQVDRLREMNISAVAIHSGLSRRQIDVALDNCIYGSVKLLYIAPERLTSPLFLERARRMNISLLAIDEAHCISQWGYDFRPSYLRIGEVRGLFPSTPILALTASATPIVCNDIMHNLKFRESHILRGSFARKNLSYAVRKTDDKEGLLLRILSRVEGSVIVYMRTRRGCEEISKLLTQEGHTATFYHGGLPHTERSLRQEEWISGEARVIVATNAFGMGIDKADVRVVVHYSISDSLEAYYQEAGRAGRDGRRSYAVLMLSPKDISRVQRSIEGEFPSLQLTKQIYDKICRHLEIPYDEGSELSYNFDTRQFIRQERIYSGTFMSAIKLLQINGYLTLIDEMEYPARMMFIVSRDDLYRVRINHESLDHIIRTLLRLYDGIFTSFRPIDEAQICEVSGYTRLKVRELLKQLWRMRLIRYTPSNVSAMIYLSKDRLRESELYISPESYKYRRELYEERLEHMVRYSNNQDVCRSKQLSTYFGDYEAVDCGVCDICLERRNQTESRVASPRPIREEILDAIRSLQGRQITTKELLGIVAHPPQLIIEEVDRMFAEGVIEMDAAGYLHSK